MSTSHATAPIAPGPILLTGFEPFDGAELNESWEAVRLAAAALREGADGPAVEVRTMLLPVEFAAAGDTLAAAIAELRPSLVITTGLAAGRTRVTPERVAINVRDARIPDAVGAQPVDEPVIPGGPVGFLSTLPIKAITAAIDAAGIPAAVSQTAGTYVCNDVFYRLMAALEGSGVRGGFVHVPSREAVSIQDSARALVVAVRTALTTREDAPVVGGAEY